MRGCLGFFTCLSLGAAEPVKTRYAEAELVSELLTAAPGDSFFAALRLRPDSGWHVYWINPGDAGLPPTLVWNLPEGVAAGPLQFPHPRRIEVTPFASFGYSEEVWYPVRMALSPTLPPGRNLEMKAAAAWLICREECLPETAELHLTLPMGSTRLDSSRGVEWRAALAKLPVESPGWNWRAEFGDREIRLSGRVPEGWRPKGAASFFPLEAGVMENAGPQSWRFDRDAAVLTLARDGVQALQPDTLRGVLASADGFGSGMRPAIFVAAPTQAAQGGKFPLLAAVSTVVVLAGLSILARTFAKRRRP